MFKFYRSVLAAGVVALGLAACGDNVTVSNPPTPTPVVHSVTVVPASQTVTVGQAGVTFVASVVADSGKVNTVTWSSTNATVATVNSSTGVITALAPGQATIVATSVGDPTKTGAGSLTVVALPSNIAAFSVTPTNGAIAVGGTLQANSSVTLATGAPAAVVTWASSNANIASVGAATGTITGVSAGSAIITATATSGTQTATATIGITVGTGPTGVVSFSVTPSAVTLFQGQVQIATATVTMAPTFAALPVTWTSSAPSVATVVGSGVNGVTGTITAVSQGNAIISATIGTAPNTLTQTVAVTVAANATITLASITAGATAGTIPGCAGIANTPVVLTNVNCQIDININLTAGLQPLDSLVVYMKKNGVVANGGFVRAARQGYNNNIGSSGIVTLSVNTANFVKVPTTTTTINGVSYPAGVAAVDWYNGPNSVLVQLYPHLQTGGTVINCQIGANDPTCASPQSIVLNNADGWSADIQKCSGGTGVIAAVVPVCAAAVPVASSAFGTNASTGGFANDVGGAAVNVGNTYWGGPTGSGQTTAEIYAVIYNDNPGFPSGSALNRCSNVLGNGTGCINSVTWSVGIPVPNVGGNNAATTPNGGQWCAAVTQTTLPFRRTFGSGAGATSSCANYENTTSIRDNVDITAAIDGVNNPFVLVGTLTGTAPIAGPANPNFTLIPNTVVFGSTPDSARYDYVVANAVGTPAVVGAEGFNWVNANWAFGPQAVTDLGVGPAAATWRAFASANGGSTTVFPTFLPTQTGADLAETNQNCTGAGCDGYNLAATATDRLGNLNRSGTSAAFGDDRTSPQLRYSTIAAPSSFAASYQGGGTTQLALDSTIYSAFQGIYGANVVTAGQQTLFLAAAAGTNDSVRVDALDGRSGLSRFVENTVKFAQGGTNGAVTSIYSTSFGVPGAGLIDGWLVSPALHVTNGRNVGAPPVVPGYFTTTEYVIDRAGNVSGCPAVGTVAAPIVISGSFCGGAVAGATTPNSTQFTNPAMVGGQPGTNANLFARRTLAIDPGQPLVTGVSPNNSYTGNNPATFTLGSQDDLEVIDARLRIQYPNITIGDAAGTVGASQGLVWSYALSNTFMASGFSAGPASGTGANFGYFAPIGFRFDGAVNAFPGNGLGIVNPQVTPLTLDQFTLNVQETCLAASTPAAACGAGAFNGDPTTLVAFTKPNNVAVQVRDVFGSWIFNTVASATTGVSAEFVSALLPATVAAPGGYAVTYYNAGAATSCPQGGAVQPVNTVSCVSTGVNFRAEPTLSSASVKVFRSTESLSTTLPIFTRVDLFGLNAAGEWVFIQRCAVPATIIPNSGAQSCGIATVAGTDNGNERYWLYSFSSVASAGFTQFRALGVNASGFGLFSTRQP